MVLISAMGNEKTGITARLSIFADGRELLPYVVVR
jgi:hypothetical protein